MPQISAGSWDIIKEEYNENVKLYVQKFSTESIMDLRDAVQENAVLGYRFDRLARFIQERYRASQAKAEFLAKTETSIFMSKFRQRMFAEAGVRRYIWRTADDQRVRDDHSHLNGRIFFYNNPPVADIATGTKANPGAIWNCRCVDEPVLEPVRAGAEV
jgi:SPP1 gp7 family putative phage head morphogenesis protein